MLSRNCLGVITSRVALKRSMTSHNLFSSSVVRRRVFSRRRHSNTSQMYLSTCSQFVEEIEEWESGSGGRSILPDETCYENLHVYWPFVRRSSACTTLRLEFEDPVSLEVWNQSFERLDGFSNTKRSGDSVSFEEHFMFVLDHFGRKKW